MHNFKYAIKTLFKNKMLIFWTFIFPIVLATFFKLAFSNIENNEKFNVIDIAIVNNDEYESNAIFKEAIDNLSKSSREQIFNTVYVNDIKEASNLLNDDKIIGYLEIENSKNNITVLKNGVYETIFKTVIDELTNKINIVTDIGDDLIKNEFIKDPSIDVNILAKEIYEKVVESLNEDNIKIVDISRNNLSYTLIEFFSLIAMSSIYGGMLGMVSINYCLANASNIGKRVGVSPTKKSHLIISSALASFLVELLCLSLLFLYTIFVLNINYGNNIGLIILLSLIGALAGLSLGIFVASIFKTKEANKIGILLSITMLWCYLSGMMGVTLKYVIDKNIPIINKVNPVAMITDGLYSLYYYDTYDRFIFNIVSLLIFSFILLLISSFSLRRQKYDSI